MILKRGDLFIWQLGSAIQYNYFIQDGLYLYTYIYNDPTGDWTTGFAPLSDMVKRSYKIDAKYLKLRGINIYNKIKLDKQAEIVYSEYIKDKL